MKTFSKTLTRYTVAAILLSTFFLFSFTARNDYATMVDNGQKITICHTPPGNPGNCHEISVSLNALQAHLDHGDALVCHNPNDYLTYMVLAEASQNQLILAYP
ncbi:MAG TPA: hypothetical protein VI112_13660 [Bacteroidia bacterium]